MAKADSVFFIILAWSVVSTTLLAWQFRRNAELERQAADAMRRGRRPNAKGEGVREFRNDPQQMHRVHLEKRKTRTSSGFPFERSLDAFTRSSEFYLSLAASPSGDGDGDGAPPRLEWSEATWKTLAGRWDRAATFADLLDLSTPLRGDARPDVGALPTKLILHCVPKAASTTLRNACKRNMAKHCGEVHRSNNGTGALSRCSRRRSARGADVSSFFRPS